MPPLACAGVRSSDGLCECWGNEGEAQIQKFRQHHRNSNVEVEAAANGFLFPQFTELSQELQDAIWKQAVQGPRFIEKTTDESWERKARLRVCTEFPGLRLYVNCNSDTFVLRDDYLLCYVFYSARVRNRIRHIACGYQRDGFFKWSMERYIPALTHLETVTLMCEPTECISDEHLSNESDGIIIGWLQQRLKDGTAKLNSNGKWIMCAAQNGSNSGSESGGTGKEVVVVPPKILFMQKGDLKSATEAAKI